MSVATGVVQRLSTFKNWQLAAAAVVFAALLPMVAPSTYYLQVLIRIFLFIALVASWNVIGYTGYINFGHAAFYGVGAYVLGFAVENLGIPIVAAVPMGGIVAGVVGLILGAVTLRLRGHYFSIASLLLLFIVATIFTNIDSIIPGARMEIWLGGIGLGNLMFHLVFYYIFLAFALLLVGFSVWLESSKYGYGMRAIREDEDIAASLGVPTARLKTAAITVSAFLAGAIGAVHAQFLQYIDAAVYFEVTLTFILVFMGVVGSMGRWYGPIVGVLLFIPADEALTILIAPEVGRIIYGLLFVVIILLLPRGLGRYIANWVASIDTGTDRGGGGSETRAEPGD